MKKKKEHQEAEAEGIAVLETVVRAAAKVVPASTKPPIRVPIFEMTIDDPELGRFVDSMLSAALDEAKAVQEERRKIFKAMLHGTQDETMRTITTHMLRKLSRKGNEFYQDQVWTTFKEMLTYVPRGMRAVVDGMMLEKNRREGGKADKTAKAVMAKVREFARASRLSANEIWKLFPLAPNEVTVRLADGEYKVYRDGDNLIQVNPRGNERSIGQSTLERYVSRARAKS